MQAFMIEIMNKFGYFGVLFLIAIENIFPPIPSEVILTYGGFMTQRPTSTLEISGVIFFATIGSLIGALILYYIGKLLNKETLIKIISSKSGKLLCLKPRDIEKANEWFENQGNKTVFFCRFIPILRSLISIPAGMSNMKFSKFLFYTIVGSIGWNAILVIAGSIVGKRWELIVNIVNSYSKIVLISLIILAIIGTIIFYRNKKRK